jgi:hypothetical protein
VLHHLDDIFEYMAIKIGDTVRVIRRRNREFWGNVCVGMVGTVFEIDDSVYTDREKKRGAEKKIKVRANEMGPLAKNEVGTNKGFYRWKPGDWATFWEEELTVLSR